MKKLIAILLWLFLLGYGFWNYGEYKYHLGGKENYWRVEAMLLAVEMQNITTEIQRIHIMALENEIKKMGGEREYEKINHNFNI